MPDHHNSLTTISWNTLRVGDVSQTAVHLDEAGGDVNVGDHVADADEGVELSSCVQRGHTEALRYTMGGGTRRREARMSRKSARVALIGAWDLGRGRCVPA